MRRTVCSQCGRVVSVNDTWRLAGKDLCGPCTHEAMLTVDDLKKTPPQRQVDPTVCAHCAKDHGTEIGRLAGLPTCEACTALFRNRPFPRWIHASALAILALVIFCLIWNARFMQAYVELRESGRAFERGDLDTALTLGTWASRRIPEAADLAAYAAYLQGVAYLRDDRSAEALDCLRRCRDRLPKSFDVEILMIHAESGVAFDAKDYDRFLDLSELLAQKDPKDPGFKAMVASALACKYVVTGDKTFHRRAMECLEEVRTLSNADPGFSEYANRILYRLHSRQIINRKTFQEQFPNGWTPPSAEQGREE